MNRIETAMTKKITIEVPDDFDPGNHEWKIVEPGKGGRPRVDLKKIAVFLCKQWLATVNHATPTEASRWICAHWKARGIHDASRARQRAKEGGELANGTLITSMPGGCLCFQMPMKEGSRGWMWHHGLHEAVEIESTGFTATIERGRPITRSPIASAAAAAAGRH